MVALSGPGWKLAPSLVGFVNEANVAYPRRDKTSDGSVGDLAHQNRDSDHNPFDGWVHAVDLDEDLAPGLDLKAMAEVLREEILRDVAAGRTPRIRYLIYEGRTCKSYPRNGYAAGVWQPYTGTNAHLHHLHLSIDRTAAARGDGRNWGFGLASTNSIQEDDMNAAQDKRLTTVEAMVKELHTAFFGKDEGKGNSHNLARRIDAIHTNTKP